MSKDWRNTVPADEREHWERVFAEEAAIADRARRDGVRYTYVPWYAVQADRLIGKPAAVAYWTHGFGDLPWGHLHAHGFAFAFERVSAVGADWVAFGGGDSRMVCSYDVVCVRSER